MQDLDPARERLLKSLAFAVFFIFFSGYMLAPLIPSLSTEFHASIQHTGWIVPAYLLPYGFSTLFYGPISDWVGRRRVLIVLSALSAVVSFLTSRVSGLNSLIALRIVTGLCAGGIAPIALALVGDLYPFRQLGRAMGWLFGAIAGGMSFGSTLGAWLNPLIGWRNEFLLLGLVNAVACFWIMQSSRNIEKRAAITLSPSQVFRTYFEILRHPRGWRTYALVFMNGFFHSGVFSWLGFYFARRFQLNDVGIGLALLGYGLPGMFLGPPLGRLADKFGRSLIIPLGMALAALCAFALIPQSPVLAAAILVTVLSTGFDMTQPLLSGIVATLSPSRRGQAMGLNAFAVFTGFGAGAVGFQTLVAHSFNSALWVFGTLQLALAFFALRSLRLKKTETLI